MQVVNGLILSQVHDNLASAQSLQTSPSSPRYAHEAAYVQSAKQSISKAKPSAVAWPPWPWQSTARSASAGEDCGSESPEDLLTDSDREEGVIAAISGSASRTRNASMCVLMLACGMVKKAGLRHDLMCPVCRAALHMDCAVTAYPHTQDLGFCVLQDDTLPYIQLTSLATL